MKELKVNQISDLLAFSYNTQENLERSDVGALVGSIGTNGELAYLARGTAIEVVKTNDGSRRSACNLAAARDNMKIVCIKELLVGDSRKLLLGLEVFGWKRGGLLCVFDISLSKVIRAIWLPQAVTAISAVEDIQEFESNLSVLSNEMHKSLVIVGCKGGQVLIIKIGEMKPYDHQNDLSLPAELEYIKLKNLCKFDSSEFDPSTNYCIDLSANSCSNGSFRYLDPRGKPLKVFKRGDVAVSSLLPMKQASLLVAGYTFGCFQIWDLQTLQLIFSSCSPSRADVSHLTFQEPENDPRYCCYLLVGRTPSPSSDMNMATTITLYQLIFEVKELNDAGFFIYRDLEAVNERFDHQLTSDSNHLADIVSIGSRIVACSTLGRNSKQHRLDQSLSGATSETEGRHTDTTLSYVIWESPPQEPEKSRPSYHLGLFDINRWYQLQMPSSIGYAMYGSSDPVCPFFAFYSLSDVSEVISPDALVDCFINAKDVSSFNSPVYPTLEQNFWPSALAFKCVCLAESGIVKTDMLGMQRQILADLVARGSEVFIRGYQLINLCWAAGLVPKLEVSRLDDPQIQFECLMSVAMEHNVMTFIVGCVRDWSRGEITNAGSCLRSVLQWAWKRVIKAKGLLDEYYIPLFYSESSKLDDDVVRNLSNCTDELKRLLQVLGALRESAVSITDEGVASLATKFTVTDCIHRYAEAILFLVRSEILPESTESKQVSLKSPFDGNLLFIDEYCQVLQQKIRENDNDDFGWDGQYPPPSVNVVCKSLLLDVPRDDLISFLYYWILDAAECLKLDKLAENASYFFNISKTKKNVIEATWKIDHNHFEEGVEKLMEFGPELLPQAMEVVYRYGNRSLACGIYKAKEMLLSGDTDWKLCIRILVENMAIYEAYKLQAKYRSSDVSFELFQYFLEQCFKNDEMPKLFDLYLTEDDEDLLYRFLEAKKDPVSKELLVLFCIKRHRYAEAIKHGASFENQQWTFNDRSLFGGVPSRRAIVQMSSQLILPMQKKIISYPSKHSAREARESIRPEPLSAVIVKKSSTDTTLQSATIFKVLDSIGANRSDRDNDAFGESFDFPFVRSAKTRTGRKRRENGKQQLPTEVVVTKSETKSILKPPRSDSAKSEVPVKKRRHLFYGSEAMKLLQTPPVIRNPRHLKSIRHLQTPTSILKKPKEANINEDTKKKSARKRVVISDPNVSISPEPLPESPSHLPESPSCLTPEVFKEDESADSRSSGKRHGVSFTGQSSDDIKRNLDLDLESKEKDAGLEASAKEPDVTSDRDANEMKPGASNVAGHSLIESMVERDIAVVDTTGIKEAEIRSNVDDESMDVAGYEAKLLNLPVRQDGGLKEEIDAETKEQSPLEERAAPQCDVVKDDLLANSEKGVVSKRSVSFAEDSNPESENSSMFVDACSQDVTLDFYEERHGISATEYPSAPSLASEILETEGAVEDSQVVNKGSMPDGDEAEMAEALGMATQDEAIKTGQKESSEEFVLELEDDADDLEKDEGMRGTEETAKESGMKVAKDEVESPEGVVKNLEHVFEKDSGASNSFRNEVASEQEMKIEGDFEGVENGEEVEREAKEEEEARLENTDSYVESEDEKEDKNASESMRGIEAAQEERGERISADDEKKIAIAEEEIKVGEDERLKETGKWLGGNDVPGIPAEKFAAVSSDIKPNSDEEKLEKSFERTDGKMNIVDPQNLDACEEEENEAPALTLDLQARLKPSFSLNTPSSDPSTPDSYLGAADSCSPVRLSEVETPEAATTTAAEASGTPEATDSFNGRSSRKTVGEVLDDSLEVKKGNIKVIVGKTDVTSSMHCFDSSFESHESSFASSPSAAQNYSLPFDEFPQEREATPPKQARKAETTKIVKRRKAEEKKTKSTSPLKSTRSNSPAKSRRSCHTPKKTTSSSLYTPPITRLSSKKGTPATRALQEIGESSLLSTSISESPISFTKKLAESEKEFRRDRSKRYSLQSPLVTSTHKMTLRSRTPKDKSKRLPLI